METLATTLASVVANVTEMNDNSTGGYNVTDNPGNSSLGSELTTYKAKSLLYLPKDKQLNQYLEFQVAYALDTIYAPICSSLGIIGNVMSFLVLMLSKSTTTYQYMAAISCTDTLVLILNIMFMVRKFPGHEIFVEGTCKLIIFLFFFAIHTNVILMVTMTLERYLAIRFPLKAPVWFSVYKARMIILIEMGIVFILNFHNFFTRKMIPLADGSGKICSSEGMSQDFLYNVWPWIDAVWYCYLPLTCLCTLNVLIILQIKRAGKRQRQMTQTDSGTDNRKNEGSAKERQITIMLLLVTFCFVFFVSPLALIILIERFYWVRNGPYEDTVYHLTRTIFNNMMYTNHALNFLLYFLSGKRFRDQFANIVCSWCNKPAAMTSAASRMTLTSSAGSSQAIASVEGGPVSDTPPTDSSEAAKKF